MGVAVRNFVIVIVGLLAALFMGFGRFLFGVGGELTWWYAPLIALPFFLQQLFALQRMIIAERRGRSVGRSVYVALVLSWLCALGFGFTVPDLVGGELVSVLSHLAGDSWIGMSIALCNPLGILAFATSIAAVIFANLAGRDPRPTEDDLLDAAEARMVPHPFEQS